MAESSSLLTFIEQGLAHIETLHSQHGQVLKEVADEIRALSELAAESQLLVQEAEAVMGIIGNVATQTRILGINASIESARTGELGRGFAVVADAIHKLSASTINSVSSVDAAMEKMRGVLESMASSVHKVVQEVQEVEAQQGQLAQELHTALEEMVRSAERLAELAGEKQKEAAWRHKPSGCFSCLGFPTSATAGRRCWDSRTPVSDHPVPERSP